MKSLTLALLALAMAGCESQSALSIHPVEGDVPSLEAKFVPASTGGGVLAFDSQTLPPRLKDAKSLQVAFGTLSVPVTKSAKGHTASVPSTARLNLDVEGRIPLVFIADQACSQVVEVKLTQVASL